LNHRKNTKADPSRLIPLKPTENVELLFVYVLHRPFTSRNASLVVCSHICAIACALKQTFAQCKILLEGTLSGAFGFHECASGSGALIFHGSDSISGFCSFLHINIFSCLGVPQVESKVNYIKCTKVREYTKPF